MLLRKYLLTLILAISLPISAFAAEDSTLTKHDGIEITVNINTASAEELATLLKGVGKKRAQDIVDYRKANGEFQSAEELTNVKGIGRSTLEKNSERIQL
ncbi:ComEA family DNA-binding protein [Vibrio clamense]|uniref:ComEA family DNA-binding protein n=1 Tax=Vibrio TaxID=662 RepID=UPI00352E7B8D